MCFWTGRIAMRIHPKHIECRLIGTMTSEKISKLREFEILFVLLKNIVIRVQMHWFPIANWIIELEGKGEDRYANAGIGDLFEDSGSLQVSQKFDDVIGHGWWRRQMVSGGLESVLIGDPVDGEDGAVGGREGVTSFRNGSALFGCLAHLFLRSAFFDFDAILALESTSKWQFTIN